MADELSKQEGNPPSSKRPSGWDVAKQAAVTATTFAIVTMFAGPVVGAIAAAAVDGAGNGSVDE